MTTQASIRYTRTPDGAEIAYAVVGAGRPVVIAAPMASQGVDVSLASTTFMRSFAPLREGHALVLFDWRGVGASGPAPSGFSPATFAADLDAVIDALDAPQVDLVGQMSLGHVAIEYAARNPDRVRRLALAPLANGSARSTARYGPIHALLNENWSLFVETLALLQWGWSDVELARVARSRLDSRFNPELWSELMAAVEALDAIQLAPELRMPVAALTFENLPQDAASVTRRLAASAPNARTLSSPVPRVDNFTSLDLVAAFLSEDDEATAMLSPNLQTVLFTDLTGSTDMHSRLGDDAAHTIVRAHDAAVRRSIELFNGREIKHTGDGIMATFGSAVDAVRCALRVCRDLETYNAAHDAEEIHVRFGLNAGEPIVDGGDDLFGLAVNLAARIANWGEPGRVLVSDVLRQLLLGKGFAFTPAGLADLKGFREPIAIFEVSEGTSE